MRIKVCYFARLREKLGISDEIIDLPDNCGNISSVRAVLQKRDEIWQQAFASDQSVLSALNHEMVTSDHQLEAGDELAFFPPVTGG
ncbi:MAG: molybdopterin converting factor subunit 1 [Gammaproteobacteria bacterium]|nr:molybdopterin converting factor subunit 1 [Gammaproteobacteria bacterium]